MMIDNKLVLDWYIESDIDAVSYTHLVVQERRLFPGLLALHVHDAYRSDADNLGAGCFRLLRCV